MTGAEIRYPVTAVTVPQPFASLVMCGALSFIVRAWESDYRGHLAIHAAEDGTLEVDGLGPMSMDAMRTTFARHDLPDRVPFGAVLGVADLWRVLPGELVAVSDAERQFGYRPGRTQWGWLVRPVEAFAEPVPYAGRSGLFTWPEPAAPDPPIGRKRQGRLNLEG